MGRVMSIRSPVVWALWVATAVGASLSVHPVCAQGTASTGDREVPASTTSRAEELARDANQAFDRFLKGEEPRQAEPAHDGTSPQGTAPTRVRHSIESASDWLARVQRDYRAVIDRLSEPTVPNPVVDAAERQAAERAALWARKGEMQGGKDSRIVIGEGDQATLIGGARELLDKARRETQAGVMKPLSDTSSVTVVSEGASSATSGHGPAGDRVAADAQPVAEQQVVAQAPATEAVGGASPTEADDHSDGDGALGWLNRGYRAFQRDVVGKLAAGGDGSATPPSPDVTAPAAATRSEVGKVPDTASGGTAVEVATAVSGAPPSMTEASASQVAAKEEASGTEAARRLEEARRAEMLRKAEKERRAAELRAEETMKRAKTAVDEAARRAEADRQAEVQRVADAKAAEAVKQAEAAREAEARKALEAAKLAEAKAAEAVKKAEAAREAEARKAVEAAKLAEAKAAAAVKQAEAAREAEARKAVEAAKLAEAKAAEMARLADLRHAAELRASEDARRAKEAAERATAETARIAAETKTVESAVTSAGQPGAESGPGAAPLASADARGAGAVSPGRADGDPEKARQANRRAADTARKQADRAAVSVKTIEAARRTAELAVDRKVRRRADRLIVREARSAAEAARRAIAAAALVGKVSPVTRPVGVSAGPAPIARPEPPGAVGARGGSVAAPRTARDRGGASDRAGCGTAGARIKRPGWYVVGGGDSLWSIAAAHYGNGKRYRRILRANGRRLDHPDGIAPCQRVYLP